jgi:predicted MPP superfamily phosphohydrolase
MLVLHLSDIHFRHPECSGDMDPDRPFRTLLKADVAARVTDLGAVGAIFVTGDIAYKGAKEEYDAAYLWLTDLAKACGCDPDRIYVVPGNHDVDREIIRKNLAARNAQNIIFAAAADDKEAQLRDQFRYIETGRSLLAPLEHYNAFAARFECQLFPPDRLFWHQDLSLDHGTKLRIHGLTSTLLSGRNATNDVKTHLYLSPLQTMLDPVDDVVNVVLAHHPPDWCSDSDDIEDAIRARSQLHFFGHKHRQRLQITDTYIKFSAGAVNPDRYEPAWEPGYNLIELSVELENNYRFLNVSIHQLTWQNDPDRFVPKKTSMNEEVFNGRLRVRGLTMGAATMSPKKDAKRPNADVSPSVTSPPAMAEDTKNLVYRFWSLTTSQRREIAKKLELIDEEEMRLAEAERYGRALLRAKDRNLIVELAREIKAREGG